MSPKVRKAFQPEFGEDPGFGADLDSRPQTLKTADRRTSWNRALLLSAPNSGMDQTLAQKKSEKWGRSGTESRIARFPESWGRIRQKFRSEKHEIEWNRSKVESRKIDSESPSESQPINALSSLKRPWNSTIRIARF